MTTDNHHPVWYQASPPAKLNLFLELLARRDDGYHELDTIMVAIDWRDELSLCPRDQPGIDLQVQWLPTAAAVAAEMNVTPASDLLSVPTDDRNLVVQATKRLSEVIGYKGGWTIRLGKRIPSGAGMGGASSDAATAMRLVLCALETSHASTIANISENHLSEIAAGIGSDVPFFLGKPSMPKAQIARASGRGERLEFFETRDLLHFVVLFPAVSVSTAKIYGRCRVPNSPRSGDPLWTSLQQSSCLPNQPFLHNALREAACGLSSEVERGLHCLARSGLEVSEMTGSGSACFGWVVDSTRANEAAAKLDDQQTARIRAVKSCTATPPIRIVPHT